MLVKKIYVVGISTAEAGWRALYRDADDGIIEEPVCAWGFCEVFLGGDRQPVGTEVRGVVAVRPDARVQCVTDDCIGYAHPGQTAHEFLRSHAAELGLERFSPEAPE